MSYPNGLDNPELYFQTKLWTGNGASSRSHTFDGSEDMQPDWVWIKDRDQTNNHQTFDSVRGVTKTLQTDRGIAETAVASMLTAFGADGFTTGDHSSMNDNNIKYASWSWKAVTSFSNDASATGVGTIDSTGSVSVDSGFSIISYTGTGSAGTIAHGGGSTPKMIITKNRDHGSSGLQDWCVYHPTVGSNGAVFLNLTNTKDTHAKYFNDTDPTSSVFSVGTNLGTNGSADAMIAYIFCEKQGFSKISTYIGNDNADGTFVYTGFAPAWVMIKRINSTNNWIILDRKRNPVNPSDERIFADQTTAASTANTMVDFLSNGFKARSTYGGINGSGDEFIFIAFAESPFVNSKSVPNNAI